MRVGIVGAMDVEVELLRSSLEGARVERRAGMEFARGTLDGCDVVVVRCGEGKVRAGMCVQALCDLYGVTHVVNTGIAGSLDPTIDVGDVVVSTACCYWDVDVTVFGYAPGQLPHTDGRDFVADPSLRRAALRAVAEAAPEISAFEGRVVSGDQFVHDDVLRRRLVADFGGRCCEMEGAAVAQASVANGVPFVVVRAISDKPGSTSTVEYLTFEAEAARHCARITSRMVALLGEAEGER